MSFEVLNNAIYTVYLLIIIEKTKEKTKNKLDKLHVPQ